jgi:hypothetical protein
MRLALTSALLARPVDSFKQLTRGDGLLLFRLLNDIETGSLEWDYSQETGLVRLRPAGGSDG